MTAEIFNDREKPMLNCVLLFNLLDSLKEDRRVGLINRLCLDNKLIIFMGGPNAFKLKGKTAEAILCVAPIDPAGIKSETYLCLGLNESIMPKVGEESDKSEKFKRLLNAVALIIDNLSRQGFNPVVFEELDDENSFRKALSEIRRRSPSYFIFTGTSESSSVIDRK